MPEPLRRKRFQIHLSTAIVMMFVAGGLMWVNLRGQVNSMSEDYHGGKRAYMGSLYYSFGWPIVAMTVQTPNVEIIGTEPLVVKQVPLNLQEVTPHWNIGAAVINGLIVLATLFSVWFLSEWRIRRDATRIKSGERLK